MAISSMSTLRSLLFLCCFLQVQGQVFKAPRTQDIFLRSKRANMYLVEEILQGNLERECYEELCNYEEAREYFEDTPKTMAFWTVYVDGDQCQPNPCLHGGNCTDKVGGFHCTCPATHQGQSCERRAGQPVKQSASKEFLECPTSGPTACHQLCTVSYRSFTCSCLPGFTLQSDGRTCQPEVEFPCGRFPEESTSTTSVCHHGNCPWQVSLLNSRGVELCSGVILGRFSVLTAAHCLYQGSDFDLRPSRFYVIPGNTKAPIPVQELHIHERFRLDHNDNDLAVLELARPLTFSPDIVHLCLPNKDFCENILMHSGRTGITKKRGLSQMQNLAYMTLDECRQELKVSHPLSNKMFCMRPQSRALVRSHGGPPTSPILLNHTSGGNHTRTSPLRAEDSETKSGGLLLGTPVATVDRGTVFVTGLLMSSSTEGDGLVFTKLSRYLSWIKPTLESTEEHATPQVRLYPEHG